MFLVINGALQNGFYGMSKFFEKLIVSEVITKN